MHSQNATLSSTAPMLDNIARRPMRSASWREKRNAIGSAAFIALLCTTLVDINVVLRLLTGQSQLASPLLLICCFGCYLAFQFRIPSSLGTVGMWYLGSFLFFIFFGMMIRLMGRFDQVELYILAYWFRLNFTSVLIISAVALGARHFVLRHSPETALFFVFAILMVQVLGVLLSQQLGNTLFAGSADQARFDAMGRSTGLLANPNSTGILMAATAAVGFACLVTGRHRAIVLVGLVAAGVACIMTFSRSAWITFLAVAVSQFFFSPIIRKKGALVGALVITCGLVWFVTTGVEKINLNKRQTERTQSLTDIFSGDYDASDTGSRFVVAALGIQSWLESPMFGHGLGKGARIETKYGLGLGPHNHFILILIETGLIGVTPYLIFFPMAAFVAWRCPSVPVRTFALGYLVVYFCNNLTAHNIPSRNYHAAFLGLMFAFLSAVAYAQKRQKRQERQNARVVPAY